MTSNHTSLASKDKPQTSQVEASNSENIEEFIDIVTLLRTIWSRRYFILLLTLLLTLIGFFVIARLTPLYTATATVLIDGREQQVVDIEDVLSGLSTDRATIESEVQVIKSRSLARRVVEELQLDKDIEFNPALREDSNLLSDAKGAIRDFTKLLSGKRGELEAVETVEESKERQLASVVNIFSSKLSVKSVGRSQVISISFTTTSAGKSQKIANRIAKVYTLSQLEAKFEATRQANLWLSERIEKLRANVQTAENAVQAFKLANNLTDVQGQDTESLQVTELSNSVALARAERAAAEARLSQVRQLVQSGGVESAAEVLSSTLIESLRNSEATLRRKLSELLTRYGEKHPRIINTRAELHQLSDSISKEVSKIVQNLTNSVEVAKTREAALNQDLDILKAKLNVNQSARVRLGELEREAAASRQIYNTFLGRFKETSEQENVDRPDARVISEATRPQNASFPKVTLFLAAVFVFSLGFSIVLVLLLERMKSGFQSEEQIRTQTDLPVLSTVPLIKALLKRRAQAIENIVERPNSAFAEAYRRVLTSILLSDIDNPPKTVVVTSATPNEGKTTCSISLSRVATMSGKRVLLMDCDLRRPSIEAAITTKNKGQTRPGLAEVLLREVELADAIIEDPITGMHVLTSGGNVADPIALLQSATMQRLLVALKERYDLIVLDAPPVMAVADPMILSSITDTTLMTVRWDATPRTIVLHALQALRDSGTNPTGIIMSMVNLKKQNRYAYGGYSYYYGRYKSYYTD